MRDYVAVRAREHVLGNGGSAYLTHEKLVRHVCRHGDELVRCGQELLQDQKNCERLPGVM